MSQDDDIPFEVPFHWRVFQFAPPEDLQADPDSRIGFYRIQRNNGEALTSPMLVDVKKGDQAQTKIIFGDSPLFYKEHASEAERAALLKLFQAVAEVLNDEERDGGLYENDEARKRAGFICRELLADYGELGTFPPQA